jgi:cytochrome P450
MAATIFYLVRSPASLQKATEEVRARFSDVEEIHQSPALNSCTYLRACIDEAMRMSPSVGGIPPREVLPGGITVDGEFIPEGTVIGTPHYTIHHNPAYYPEPFTYTPERWIAGSHKNSTGYGASTVSEDEVATAQSAFCSFSIGPRGCIGKGLAYIELSTTLARMLYLYDLRKSAGYDPAEGNESLEWGRHRPGEYQLIDQFTSLKDGPMVEFRKRQ